MVMTQDPIKTDLSNLERDLQAALESTGIQVNLRSHGDHLDLTLTRSPQTKISYPDWVRQILTTLRTAPHLQFNTLTIYGQVQGCSDLEWTLTSRIDEDELIDQVLKQDLALLHIKTLVRRKHDHLHILLTRPEEIEINYAAVMRLIREDLRQLRPSHISGITVYGRKPDHTDYEWQVTTRLQEDSQQDRDGTTIHMPPRRLSQPPIPSPIPQRQTKIPRRWIGPLIGLLAFLGVGILCGLLLL